jgi:hypothetical protein
MTYPAKRLADLPHEQRMKLLEGLSPAELAALELGGCEFWFSLK